MHVCVSGGVVVWMYTRVVGWLYGCMRVVGWLYGYVCMRVWWGGMYVRMRVWWESVHTLSVNANNGQLKHDMTTGDVNANDRPRHLRLRINNAAY